MNNLDFNNQVIHTREALPLPITALILCGGKSTRMGRSKAFLPYQGTTMISHMLNNVRDLFNEVFLVTNESPLFTNLNCDIIKDILPHRGPIGGILSGILVASNYHSFVLPCDMPLIAKKLIRKMTTLRHSKDVLMLEHANGIEPLVGIYSKNCIKPLEEALFTKDLNSFDFTAGLNVQTFPYENQYDHFLGHHILPAYFDINTPQDYLKAITGVGQTSWAPTPAFNLNVGMTTAVPFM